MVKTIKVRIKQENGIVIERELEVVKGSLKTVKGKKAKEIEGSKEA